MHLYFPLILCLINFDFSYKPPCTLFSLNINEKVASYNKLKVEFDEAKGEKAHLKGQLHQAIEDKERYKVERNLLRRDKAKHGRELISYC